MANDGNGFELDVSLRWPIETNVPSYYANQFAIMKSSNEVIVTIGRYFPNFIRRSEEEIEAYLKDAEVEPLAQLVMSPAGFEALATLMSQYLKQNEENQND